jgi:hypothetical protein
MLRVTFTLLLCSFLRVSAFPQDSQKEMSFNKTIESQLGVGFAIAGFNSNFTYFISPHYAFRYHRHWIGFTPFYGRLDAITTQQDIGVGLDYRLFPFKNENSTLLYFPVGVHYNYKWSKRSQISAVLYKIGFGVNTLLGRGFSLSLDANFGIGQTISSKVIGIESSSFGSSPSLNYYFVPVFRISYSL